MDQKQVAPVFVSNEYRRYQDCLEIRDLPITVLIFVIRAELL